ncbi:MAG: hypothetical protein RIR26_606, partial [Pseudomonadota bacterium]
MTLNPLRLTTSAAVLSALFAATAYAGRHSPSYLGQEVEVIDIHQHVGDARTLGPLGRDFLYKTLPQWLPKSLKDWSLEAMANLVLKPYTPFFGVRQECLNAGLRRCGLFAVYAPLTWGTTDNQTIEAILDDNRNRGARDEEPYFFGLASVNVHHFKENADGELAELRRSLQHEGMKGIKLAFVHNELPLDDEIYDGIYRVAREFSVPVYHHIGTSPLRRISDFKTEEERKNYLRSTEPHALEWAIARYPDVPFILGHMGFDFNREGFDFTDEVYELALKYSNVYLEISAFGLQNYDPEGKFMDAALRNLRSRNLLGRTIYGSDASG